MKSYGSNVPVISCFGKEKIGFFLTALKPVALLLFSFFLFQSESKAQCITNNTIEVKPPLCSDSRALLKGSVPSGGNGNFTYVWEESSRGCGNDRDYEVIPGATGPDYIVPLSDNGKCYRRIVRSNGCESTSNHENIRGVAGASAPEVSIINPTCTKPTATITVTSPVGAGYEYSIDNTAFQSSATFNDVAPGQHTIVVRTTSSNTCISPERQVTIDAAPAAPQAPQASVSQPTCSTPTGTITITEVSGATYSLDGGAYQQSNVFSGVQPGVHQLRIKVGECESAATSITIAQQPTPPPSPTYTLTDPTCSVETGKITVTAPIGNNYEYALDSGPWVSTTTFNDILPGEHILKVRLKNNTDCEAQTGFVVKQQPPAPQKPEVTVIQPTCPEPSGTITVTSPAPEQGLFYSINGTSYSNTSGVFKNLSPGTYNVTVKNSFGCVSQITAITINDVKRLPIPNVLATHPLTCILPKGSLTVISPLGVNLTYSIDEINFQKSPIFLNVAPGNYDVIVKDEEGCSSRSNTVSVNAAPAAPPAPKVSATHPQNCDQTTGTITVTPVTGMEYSINGTEYQQSNVFNDVIPGTYNVTVRSNTGCISSATQVTVNPAPKAPEPPTYTIVQPTCLVTIGSITVTEPIGNNYEYALDEGPWGTTTTFNEVATGNHILKVRLKGLSACNAQVEVVINAAPQAPQAPQATATHPQSCTQTTGSITVTPVSGMEYSINGQNYQQSNVFSGLAPGSYNVTVRNQQGCISQATAVVINAAPQAPQAPQATATHPQSCTQTTGSITVTPVSGMEYSINGQNYQQSNVFSGLAPGSYNVTVRNQQGCISQATAVVINAAPQAPAGTITPANASICTGSSQLLTATGGTTYQWKLNGTDIPGATSATYLATSAGTYSVTFTTNGNCKGQSGNTAVIKVQDCIPPPGETKVFVPTAFTPNKNNANDQLQPYFINVRELRYFKVFNRWGQMVFQTNHFAEGWDGTIKGVPQPTETYSWILECVDNDGKVIKQSGRSILIR